MLQTIIGASCFRPSIRNSVFCSIVSSCSKLKNCFGYILRDRGHSLVPDPPERIIGIKILPRFNCETVTVVIALGKVHYKTLWQLKTGAMSQQTSRSEQVVEDFKRHKLAISALRRVRQIILGYDEDHATNLQLARVGLAVVLMLIVGSTYFLMNTHSIILP